MPPEIIAVLAIVGFCLYFIIGSAVGVLAVHILGDADHMIAIRQRQFSGNLKGYGRTHDATNVWLGFFTAAVLWPAFMAVFVAVWVAIAVFYGPVWLAIHAGSYVASIGQEAA